MPGADVRRGIPGGADRGRLRALIAMPHCHRHPHFGRYAGCAALLAATRVPDLLAEAVRALGDARPARCAQRPIGAVRARPAPSP
jgi:hypothetical protein